MSGKLEKETPKFEENYLLKPVVFLRKLCPVPNNRIRFELARSKGVEAILSSYKDFHNEVILLMQKDPTIENPKMEDIYPIGVLGVIDYKIKQPDNSYKLRITGLRRVEVIRLLDGKFVAGQYETARDYTSDMTAAKTTVDLIDSELKENGPIFFPSAGILDEILTAKEKSFTEFSNKIIYNLKNLTEEEKYEFLRSEDLVRRLKLTLKYLKQIVNYQELEKKINASVEQALAKNSKEYYLREKIKAIQEELGDKGSREDDVEKYRMRMDKEKVPKHIRDRIEEEITRYLSSPSMSSETSMIKSYLEFATSLPWTKETVDNEDIKKAMKVLEESHYGLEKPKERILEYLAVKIKTKKNPQTIVCFVGPPGVGKTSLAISMAKALNKNFVKMSLGGIRDEAEIRGHRRTYVGAMPGRILKQMEKAQSINPLFLLDEVDKITVSNQGDPIAALLEVLDPEQNYRFSDNYLEEPYDLSKVLFITTANYLENIPAPLRDRMEIIELSSYTEHEKFHIAKSHLVPKALKEHGVKNDEFILPDDSIYYLIRHYTREAGVRELSRVISSLLRKIIKTHLEKKIEKTIVDEKTIEKHLGPKKFTHQFLKAKNRIGVVTGLAYTQYGGDTLEIEATMFPGKGALQITGKLGDVMKESVQAAFSYVKSISEEKNIDFKVFQEHDFHVHVPEGAIPKDGPSAGITIATAIYSLVSGKEVNRKVGMTGEITITGEILPIGGLKEKSIAAHRTGLSTILIPEENKKDLYEVPEEVKKSLNIIPVKSLDEVFENAIIGYKTKNTKKSTTKKTKKTTKTKK